jgi:hypothetical protein
MPQASTYVIQVDTTNSFFNPLIKTPVADTTFQLSVDLPIDTLFWQVTATINDTLSYFSETGSFIIQDPRVPILYPIIPKATQQKRPSFKWHPVSGASSYTLQVSNSNVFAATIITLPLTDTLTTTSSDLPIGMIYWRVKSDLLDKWSLVDSFQIQSDTVPFLVRFNGDTVSIVRPNFLWNKVQNAASYRIEWADNAGFTNTYATLVQDTSFTPTADLTSGTWFWKVSCSLNYNLYPIPDSLVVGQRVGARLPNVFSRKAVWGVKTCEATVYSMSGIRLARISLSYSYASAVELLKASGTKLAKGVYLIELRKNGIPIARDTFLQR